MTVIQTFTILVLFVNITNSAFFSVSDLNVTFTPGTKHVNITSPGFLTCEAHHKTRCDRICVMTPGCRSYFYSADTGICQFHSDVFNSTDGFAPQQGLQYYYKGIRDDYSHVTDGRIHMYVKQHNDSKQWNKALEVCHAEGGTLVKLDTREKNGLFCRTFNCREELWIGLRDKYDNDIWYWTDGTRLGHYQNWGFQQPNNMDRSNEAENCVVMCHRIFLSPSWEDFACSFRSKFVCEKFNP